MTISHMTRCPSLKPWMLAAGTSQLMIAKGGSDIPGGFIPGASPWITSDVMLMKTCGLTLKIAENRYSNFVLFFVPPPPFLSGLFAVVFLFRMQYCKTFSVLSYRVSTVLPVVNSKGKKTYLLFTGMLLNVNITVHVDIQFPTKTFSVKTVDCMFCMQIAVKLKYKSLCSFCNVNNSQYFETWCTLIDCMYLVK